MRDIRTETQLKGKRVLVRIDIDDALETPFPVRAIVPTISFLREQGARIILLAHVGRDGESSALPLSEVLNKEINVRFVPDITGDVAQDAVVHMHDGEVVFLENVRRDKREVANDEGFARELASLADVYVNEAFAVSHRKHASIVGVPQFLPSFSGIQFQKEIEMLSKARMPESPSLFILGGAKFETKLPLITAFSRLYDSVFIGGALANNFFKARGFEIGTSTLSGEENNISDLLVQENILVPIDVVVAHEGVRDIKTPDALQLHERIADAGPQTLALLKEKIAHSKTILWNGPLGEYENGFGEATDALARALAESTARTTVGGGDTAASIASLGLEEKFTFLSTGGGAMLDYLLEGTLPGIEALRS